MTDKLAADQALAMVHSIPFPTLLLSADNKVHYCNQAFENLVGISVADELKNAIDGFPNNHPALHFLNAQHAMTWQDENDQIFHLDILRAPLVGTENMEVRYFVDASKRIATEKALESMRNELEKHVLTDSRSGLLNQRGIMLALEPQVARSRRYNSPISVIMMSVHGVSENDSDDLIHVAQLLKDQLRWADLIGCTDNGEFILALPETTSQAAMALADKLKNLIQPDAEHSLTACYGVTSWRRSDNATTLLERASAALSKAHSEQGSHAIAL